MLSLFSLGSVYATGTPDLYQAGEYPVLLLIGDANYGDFASYTAPSTNQLRVRIAEAGETIYFGMGTAFNWDGTPRTLSSYSFRIKRVSDGEIVHGPILVNALNFNLATYADAVNGPAALHEGGYLTDEDFSYTAALPGDYAIEFSNNLRYAGLWDISVGNAEGVDISGRVYSQNWAFRVPIAAPVLPDCIWGAQLNTRFYSYTSDGFVSLIDFVDSGFQPLSFNLAFNRTGPGQTGNLQLDRMSIANLNATAASAEHFIFIESPDPLEFPDGSCGEATLDPQLQCSGDGYCIPISVTVPGQVEVLLDLNDNQLFDEGIDRILLHTFEAGEALQHCLYWDGLAEDGNAPQAGQTVNVLMDYTQGVQHWALYDGEKMTNGFCVTPVRPICGDGGTTMLFYDDRNVSDLSGTASPNDGRSGCDCSTPDCRTWANFDAATNDCSDVADAATTGYGDKNTLNTWWFASIQSQQSLNIPLSLSMIDGAVDFCPADSATLLATYTSSQSIASVVWEGPGEFLLEGGEELLEINVGQAGVYTVTIVDELGCSTSTEHLINAVVCTMTAEVASIICNSNGTDTDPTDDYFTAEVIIHGSNSDTWTTADGQISGNYGSTVLFGPYPIAEGDRVYELVDSNYGCCTSTLVLEAPAPCSEGCAIAQTLIGDNLCDENGTPTDSSDDTFTFSVTLGGYNLSAGWVSSQNTFGDYGVPAQFGPFSIADGNVSIGFEDDGDAACTVSVVVTPTGTCSNECLFVPTVTNVVCQDNDTPYDPLDDTYTFDLDVNSINATNSAFEVTEGGIGLYGFTMELGPYPISAGVRELTIADVVNASCTQQLAVQPPSSCSSLCGIEIVSATPNCDDNGTPEDVTDDLFYYDILVNSFSESNTSWVASDGSNGAYGVLSQSVAYQSVNGPVTITVMDAVNATCEDTVVITVALPEINCPQDVEIIGQGGATLSNLSGGLVNVRNYFEPEDDLSCWLEETALQPGGRFYDRFTFSIDAPLENGAELYTFYLFEQPTDTATIGAVFNLGSEEEVDCCALVNPGPIPQWDQLIEGPVLRDSFYPEDMNLVQQFTVLLRPQEDYTLVTTTWSLDTFGNYQWVVVAPNGHALETEADYINSWYDYGVFVDYQLYTYQLDDILNELNSFGSLPQPSTSSGCGQVEFIARDTVISENCGTTLIQRYYDAVFQDTVLFEVCSQAFLLDHLGIDDVVFPQQAFIFSCTDTFPTLANGNPDPAFTGQPSVYDQGVTVFLSQEPYEGLVAVYFDRDSIREDGGLNIYRDWFVVDQCNAEDTIYTQLFKLETAGIPALACPLTNHYCPILGEDIMLFSTEIFACTANILVPLPDLINICDPEIWTVNTLVYRVDTLSDGSVDTTDLIFLGPTDERQWNDVPPGDYFVLYTAIHPNEDTLFQTCRFRVADLIEPTAICRSSVSISLPGSGLFRMFTTNVNLGSYDNCEGFILHIRRSYTNEPTDCAPLDSLSWSAWGPYVDFNCCDVGSAIEVQLRITDASGNQNYCTTNVDVFDNTLPYCTGLETQNISCQDLPDDFDATDTLSLRAIFGMPEVIDNCSAFAFELAPVVVGDQCAPEQITRRFQAVDQHGNLASAIFTQTINVTPSLDYAIRFPRNTVTDCINNPDTLQLIGTACDNFSVVINDQDLPVSGEECRRIERTFLVTNWCEWDGLASAVVLGNDYDCNDIPGETAVWVIRRNETAFIDLDSTANNATPFEGQSLCPGGNPNGYWAQISSTGRWSYTQIISIFDQTPPSLTAVYEDSLLTTGPECDARLNLSLEVFDACGYTNGSVLFEVDLEGDGIFDTTYTQIDQEVSGDFPLINLQIDLPLGQHSIQVTATDGCNNAVEATYVTNVFDGYVPELSCQDYRLYNLEALEEPTDIDDDGFLEEAAVYVDAAELGTCLFADCSGPLLYTVNRPGTTPSLNQAGIFLDCQDRYQVELEVYVWDNANNPFSAQPDGSIGGPNWRTCQVTVLLQDPDQACNDCQGTNGNALSISGDVLSREEAYIPGVLLEIVETGQTTTTNNNGRFTFVIDPSQTAELSLSATKNDDTAHGLSTLDVLLIQYHILQTRIITDPYLLLAADINADGLVNVIDLMQLQAVVIGLATEFPNNQSWIFFPADWNGVGEVPTGIVYQNLQACVFDAQLRGIKVGELSESLNQGELFPVALGLMEPTPIDLLDREVRVGETIQVAMTLPAARTFSGGQFSLLWQREALEYVGLASDQLRGNAINTSAAERGLLSVSYLATSSVTIKLKLSFTVLQNGRLSELIELDQSAWLNPEVYRREDLRSTPLYLNWQEKPSGDPVKQLPNAETIIEQERMSNEAVTIFPNPAVNKTQLNIQSAKSGTAKLVVTDAAGRIVWQDQFFMHAGHHQYSLRVNEWPVGTYALRLTTATSQFNGVILKK